MRAFARALRATLLAVWADKGVLLLLAIAPVLYGFFYPWPYMEQAVTRVPVAVVDLDHSSLSRQITRFASASPRLDVRWVGADLQEAQRALWAGEIEGFAILPPDLKRHVLRGQSAVVTVEGDGAYALLNKAVLYGFAEAVGTVSAGVEIRKLQAAGQGARQAAASRSPVGTLLVPLFNPTEGYGSYVVPAVALLILQQTLLMGAAMLVGTWAETGQQRARPAEWIGRVVALSVVGCLAGLFYFGWEFTLQDFPRGGNPLGALLLLACYMPAVACLGCLLGLWFRDRERSMQVLLLTSLPMAFLSGFSWPAEALPGPLQVLRWLVPSTAGIQASLRLNQMGAPVADVLAPLGALAALTLVVGGAVLWAGRLRKS
ncbi:ABC transporter permease [Curvibacter sp. APW13]|uniref:ABC transporter permease n=1 Tax=Curvibacter sp. APW13 TaxID=3077236 RepID=UPI0028DF67F0|nr:ABC transporter permease [Curvibacter sp. APW13]MDT8992971.1 ABC transporter permease [Curvibacter sp. APW13]